MRPVFIYTLNDPVTGIVRYCGQTVNPDRRLVAHLNRCKGNKYHCARWVNSLLGTGVKPTMEILDVVPDNEADFWEMEYIQNFRERGFDLTNASAGGKGGSNPSAETRAKISASNSGKKRSPEVRAKNSASCLGRVSGMKGKKHSVEANEKNRKAHLGKPGPNLGKKFSEEHCARISAAKKGLVPWNKGKKLKGGV